MIRLTLSVPVMMLILCSLTHAQDYRYESLHLAGTIESYAHDINNDNVVVGAFLDEFDFATGFIWEDGRFDTPSLDLDDVFFNGIDDAGTIVGVGIDFLSFAFPSFTLRGEELTTFQFPGATLTFADGINNQGEIVGVFVEAPDSEDEFFRSFHKDELGQFAELSFEGYADVAAIDINNNGQIVGGVYDVDGASAGFIFDNEGFRVFDHPDGATELLAINDHGTMVGSVDDGETLRSFVFDGQDFYDVAFPGATETAVWSINNQGVIVGEFIPEGGENYRAFIAYPVPEPSGQLLAILAIPILVVARRQTPDRSLFTF